MSSRKRKPPRPHKVNTKHPRYDVNQYDRGSGAVRPRNNIRSSELHGLDPDYFESRVNPYAPDFRYVAPKEHMDGRRTLTYLFPQTSVDKQEWSDLLDKYRFSKVSDSNGKGIVYRNPQGMYVIVMNSFERTHHITDEPQLDLNSVYFKAHPERINDLEKLVEAFRGTGEVPEMDTDYLADKTPKSKRGVLVWSKDGEIKPDPIDYKPVEEQRRVLRERIADVDQEINVRPMSDVDRHRAIILNRRDKRKLESLEGIRN